VTALDVLPTICDYAGVQPPAIVRGQSLRGVIEKPEQRGAEFVVSPVTNFDMIQVCRRRDTFVAPGAFTPTEIVAAWKQGADVVKVFPATSVGPKYFKDLKGPLPQIRLMPTGGVSIENAADFIRNGACCVAIGTALLDQKSIERNDWEALTAKAAALVESLRGI
jgi:2-dehydro-3-deoxyphosphogluconate aldolase/(4S)-4-hydroxy-2-oxoglutarate aldolase